MTESPGDARGDPRRPSRRRGVDRQPFPPERRLVTAAERAGRRMVPMHGLVRLDVTDARRRLAARQPPLSLTAFLIASVARAAAAHPAVHAYRDWRGRVVLPRHVDVATIIEVVTPHGPFPMAHLVRDADVRDVAAISAELRSVKHDPRASSSGRLLERFRNTALRAPGAVPLLSMTYSAMTRSVRAHEVTGTIMLTSVGMFAGGGGFGIAPPTLLSLQVLVGGMSASPVVTDGGVEVRQLVDLTVTIDHNIVDGGPATRFGADLRSLVESAAVLDAPEA